MPGMYALTGAGVLEGFVLQPGRSQLQLAAQREQALAVGAHEVRHRLALQSVPVKPNAAVQGEAHPLAAACELAVGGAYEQEILPSIVAVPGGVATPENT